MPNIYPNPAWTSPPHSRNYTCPALLTRRVSYYDIWHTIDSVMKLEVCRKHPLDVKLNSIIDNGVYRIEPLSMIFLMISKPNRPSVSVTLNDT